MSSAQYTHEDAEHSNALTRGEERIAALMHGTAERVRAGVTLIEAGTEHPFAYRLLEGWAHAVRTLPDGREQSTLILLPGDVFCVHSLFLARHAYAVRTFSDVLVERVPQPKMRSACMRDSDIAFRCMWQAMEERSRLQQWVVGLGCGTAEERVALFLLEMGRRLAPFAEKKQEERLSFHLPMTQNQIGNFVGLTAVHVNRVLRTLREKGTASVRDGFVSIPSLHTLRRCTSWIADEAEAMTWNVAPVSGAQMGSATAPAVPRSMSAEMS
jgi:CRP/FNR family transcriptional regulator, anaerobic regulatory protein